MKAALAQGGYEYSKFHLKLGGERGYLQLQASHEPYRKWFVTVLT